MSTEAMGVNDSSFEGSALSPLLTPQILLPSQYADGLRTFETSPEKRLHLAILEDGIDCWLRGGPTVAHPGKRNRAIEAERWIWGNCGLITFVECCEALDISSDWLRTKLESKRKERPLRVPSNGHAVRREKAGLGFQRKGYGVPAVGADTPTTTAEALG